MKTFCRTLLWGLIFSIVASVSAWALSPAVEISSGPVVDGMLRLAASDSSLVASISLLPAFPGQALPQAEGSRTWRITGVGDIMVHETQLKTHWDATAKAYLFDDDFSFIKPWLASSDVVIGNFETTLGGPGRKYSGYPIFNTPDTLGEALKRAGFHVLATTNNHCLDTGLAGLKRTHAVLSGLGFGIIGTRPEPKAESFLIRDLGGLKVGLAAYSYETSRKSGAPTLNGSVMPSGASSLIDSFASETLQANLASMTERVRLMRSRGAELIVFALHWGVEYGPQPTAQQRMMASHLASEGVDIIFGSHPHVVQSVSWVPSPDGKRKTLVVWSLGNFISNQRYEFLKRHDTEDGLMVTASVSRASASEPAQVVNVEYQPLWVHRHQKAGRWYYHVLPLLTALENTERFQLEQNSNLVRARNSLKRTTKLLEGAPMWVPVKAPAGAVGKTSPKEMENGGNSMGSKKPAGVEKDSPDEPDETDEEEDGDPEKEE